MNILDYALFAHLMTLGSTGTLNPLWIPPGSKGTIDFRNPDYIVDPLPACPFEGFFAHPRNCSHFYQCFSLVVEGFYTREYFECAPGTIFDDELDVCVIGTADEGCGTGGTGPGEGVTDPPLPEPVVPCTNCTYVVDNCSEETVCPNTTMPIQLQLCKNAGHLCSPCQLLEVVCEGQLFSTASETCYPPTYDPTMVCPDVTEVPTTEVPTTVPLPTPPDASPCDDCSISHSRCQPQTVCPNGGPEKTLILCPTAEIDCPEDCDREKIICKDGDYYSIFDQNCYPSPDSPSMSCEPELPPEPQTPAPPVGLVGGTITITKPVDTKVVTCSVSMLIPNDEWILKDFCYDIHLCTSNVYQGKRTLCSNYYECHQNDDGSWDAVKMECAPGSLFSFKREACVVAPTEDERCK